MRRESPGPTVCLPLRGPSEVALPPLGCVGEGGSKVLLPICPQPPLSEHHHPRRLPTTDTALQKTSAQHPGG